MGVTIEVDGSGPEQVAVPVLEALAGDGLVLSRTLHPGGPVDGPASVTYMHRSSLVRSALAFARMWPQVAPVVIWPSGVPAWSTALALATAHVLDAHRPVGPVPAVVCAVCPPMRRTRPSVRHHVRAAVGGRVVELVVWELLLPERADRASPAVVAASAPLAVTA